MKQVRIIGSIAILSLIIGFTSCTKDDSDLLDLSVNEEASIANVDDMKSAPVTFVETGDLTKDEIDGLFWMREEEKLAMDVYDLLYSTFELKIFDNISNSELSHTNAVLALINFYGLEDPSPAEAGLFSDEDLQDLYDGLVVQGTKSVIDALLTGALIEEVDILDLEEEMAITDNVNIISVYANLLEGSKRHLVAFVKNLDSHGINYEPQRLDPAVYEEILATTTMGGNGNTNGSGNQGTYKTSGNGNGNNGGNGNGNGGSK